MGSRENVKNTLQFIKPDKIPVDFGGTVVTCLDKKAHENLLEYCRITSITGPIIDYTMGTVEPDVAFKKMFDVDVQRIGMNVIKPQIANRCFTNGFGMVFRKAEPHDYYDVVHFPLENASSSDIKNMQLPDPDDDRLYEGITQKAKELFESTDYALFADFGVPGFYETSQKLRGYSNLACDLITDQDFVCSLYDKLLILQKRWFKNYLECIGKYVVAIGYADDLGMQDRLQMSPETYREIIKPYHKEIFGYIHQLADVKIMLHSCGAIEPLIEDLIDAGVDVLNPLQTKAKGMELEHLIERYGGRIAFWGGFDEQQILPFGSKEEIEKEVLRLMEIMGRNGGYVFGPGHNIQSDTKPENIVTMFEAAKKYR